MDIEKIDGDEITTSSKQFTTSVGEIASEDCIADNLAFILDDPSVCQNASSHLTVRGSSSHSFDIQQGNVKILIINESEGLEKTRPELNLGANKNQEMDIEIIDGGETTTIFEQLTTSVGQIASDDVKILSVNESEDCKTSNSSNNDREVSLGIVDSKTKMTHSEESMEGHQQCSLCWKWSTSESLFKRHILWHFFLKNYSGSVGLEIKCKRSILKEKSLEELIRGYELKFYNSQDILCWKCHRNYEIHFASPSLVYSESEPLKCLTCLNTFRCKIRLQIHMKEHLSRSPYTCCICKLDFKDTKVLIKHMNKHKQFGVFSDVCDTSHHVYPSGSTDERSMGIALGSKDKEDPSMANHHIERAGSIGKHKQSGFVGDVSDASLHINSSASADESNFEVAQSLKGKEDLNETDHNFRSKSHIEEEVLLHSRSDAKTINNYSVSKVGKNFEDGQEVANSKSAYELTKEIISCRKGDRYINNALDFMQDERSAITTVLQKLECCINLAKDMSSNSQPQSDKTCSTLEDLSELETVLKTVMVTSYGSILADVDRSKFWCKICATPFQESAKFQTHKIKFCSGRESRRELSQLRNKTRKQFQYKCFMCKKYFCNRLKRYDHMVVHFALLLKRCPVCTKHFESPSQFIDHLLTHPLMENNLVKCSACNKYLCDEEAIAKHFQRKHSVRKPYKCETCDREFFKGSSFSLHIKGHLRNKWRKSLIGMDLYKPHKKYSISKRNKVH